MRPSTPRVKVRKCAELRKNMQLSYCKSDQHIKLFLWLHPCASIMSFWAKIWKKIDICHFFKGKKSTKHAILSYFSATFQLFFPHSLRVFLKNVKCCFGFLFEKMSKLRGVENAHTWPHMVRLTQRSTSKIFASFSSVRCTKLLTSAKFSFEAAPRPRLSQCSVWKRKKFACNADSAEIVKIFRAKVRELVANFRRQWCATYHKASRRRCEEL